MDLQVEDKVFMVAASSKGLGYGIARELAKNGASVCIASRTRSDIDAVAQQLRDETGSVVHALEFDAADANSITHWMEEVKSTFGKVDGLVVNAGGPPPGNFNDFTDDDWLAAFNLTLMSAVRLIRGVLPLMPAQGGSILTITSMSVKEPVDRLLLSNIFRSGVTSLVKSLATELATKGIRVNNLMPGRIDTDRVRSLDKNTAEIQGVSVIEVKKNIAAGIPLGRYGTIEEFGSIAAFLLSPRASYITGASLAVDGGIMKTVW
ncbi:MAG: 3-oxoacyl-ACP reductase [Draconibacterium sp.]|nr:MAG: 3-oxoacyl-ACP reductase [Draconibacterium sp.]